MDSDYIEMMNYLENDTDFDDIAREWELKEFMDRIVRDESEILIPVYQRKQMQETLHFTHSAADDQTLQMKIILARNKEIFAEKV